MSFKVTKIQKYEALKTLVESNQETTFTSKDGTENFLFDLDAALAFIASEVELLKRKNENNTAAQTENQKKAEKDRATLIDFLKALGKPATYIEIQRNVPDFNERGETTQYIASIAKPLVASGIVEKGTEKGKKTLLYIGKAEEEG